MSGLRSGSCAPLLLALAWAGCASTPPPPAAPPAWTQAWRAEAARLAGHLHEAEAAAPGQVVVRLVFAPGADLDLYVTDPLLETVYYANTPSRSGGVLERDRRCDEGRRQGADAADARAEDVRVETVRFETPPPGRYRVGVDYPHRCEGGDEVMPYVVSIEAEGAREALIEGLARHLEFTTIVTEFDVE